MSILIGSQLITYTNDVQMRRSFDSLGLAVAGELSSTPRKMRIKHRVVSTIRCNIWKTLTVTAIFDIVVLI